MTAKAIMVQGTGSNVGKSVVAAALCRIFCQDGMRVVPFKAQNMALNSFVTPDGGEIGRAQAVQAEAAMAVPNVHMNPILLKPKGDNASQVILHGRPYMDMDADQYYNFVKEGAQEIVAASLDILKATSDLIVMEGAGSPAEINLQDVDIVNMKAAALAGAPVILVADIDRGGVFASLVGTLELLPPADRERVAGFIINKFRGDLEILRPGLQFLEEKTGKPVLGVLPYFTDFQIPEEDSLAEYKRHKNRRRGNKELEVAVILLPRMSNFTDFDMLAEEPDTHVRYIRHHAEIGEPDAIVLPGTKNTIDDLLFLHRSGIAEKIMAKHRAGTPLIGICGGYQMLGKMLFDPAKQESAYGDMEGLGLLDIETRFLAQKTTHQARAEVLPGQGFWGELAGTTVEGYEIHMGETALGPEARPVLRITARSGEKVDVFDGAVNQDGTVFGTYMHGIFDNDTLRRVFLNWLRSRRGLTPLPQEASFSAKFNREAAYNKLAHLVRNHLDMQLLKRIIGGELL